MKKLIILAILGLFLIAGFYAKRRFYDPKHRLNLAKLEVKEL